ncbi:MAG: carcinine hydrolase/isopenicillin-N N-acyltransferase family protein [Micrococcales bacterium]|nr:carcinine hydrolase/isopenicillin-N N-acyltransferase family protein [Micrococcales bacterium]
MCDTFVTLTDDGVLFAKNSDRDPNEAQTLRWYAAADYGPGATVRCTWSEIPQAEHTHAVLLSQPWWMWGAEMGANEHGVVIGNEAIFTRRRGRYRREPQELLGMDLLRLALERAATARDAAAVIVRLLERYGQGGSASHEHPWTSYDNSYLIADPTGAYVLETAGRHWDIEEVRGPGRAISNGLTIEGMRWRWEDPVRTRAARAAARRAHTQACAEAAREVPDLIAGLREHGGPAPAYAATTGALGAPCVHAGGRLAATQTTASWVTDLRGGAAGATHWVTGVSAPCTALFVPARVQEPADDQGYALDDHHRGEFRWWRHEELHRLALRDLPGSLATFAAERDRLESDCLDQPPATAHALAAADAAYARWADHLREVALPDRRPAWLRRRWAAWDRQAGMPATA